MIPSHEDLFTRLVETHMTPGMTKCFNTLEYVIPDAYVIAFFQDMKDQILFWSEFKARMSVKSFLEFIFRITIQTGKDSKIIQVDTRVNPIRILLAEVSGEYL